MFTGWMLQATQHVCSETENVRRNSLGGIGSHARMESQRKRGQGFCCEDIWSKLTSRQTVVFETAGVDRGSRSWRLSRKDRCRRGKRMSSSRRHSSRKKHIAVSHWTHSHELCLSVQGRWQRNGKRTLASDLCVLCTSLLSRGNPLQVLSG